ncbi:MAG: methyltransferase domain-containing protein [Candidatus Hydrogenedentes bacterium]|nr:methyltransferase domain-containing protein [Candidatus Hydrogenedentota bacterium]
MILVSTYPRLRATLFDRPEVIEIAREQVAGANLTGRIDFIPGDFMGDPLGAGYDVILVSNIIHSYGSDENRALMRKCAEALSPGGVLVVKDFFPDDERSGPPFALLFALHMFLHTEQGGTYTLSEVASWTREVGLEDGELIPVAVNSGAWIAHKPA